MKIRRLVLVIGAIFLAHSLYAKEIVVGVDYIPKKTMALIFTPIVLPDLISAKMAFEYKLLKKLNLIVPLEAKWMNYRWALRLFDKGAPESWFGPDAQFKPGWNIAYSHLKVSSGVGVKYFPFSESMTNAFFIKTIAMVGAENFNSYTAEGEKNSAVLTHALTIGYNWVKGNVFTFGFEIGEEYSYHTNPIKKLPRPWLGFSPLFQLSLGFTI